MDRTAVEESFRGPHSPTWNGTPTGPSTGRWTANRCSAARWRPPGRSCPTGTASHARWEEVPAAAYSPAERLESHGCRWHRLFGAVPHRRRRRRGGLRPARRPGARDRLRPGLQRLAAGGVGPRPSPRFIPQCIVPIWPPEAAAAEMQRAVGKGHRGIVFPALPMHLRDVPHVSGPEYDPVWSACEELGVPVSLHAGASPQFAVPGVLRARAGPVRSRGRGDAADVQCLRALAPVLLAGAAAPPAAAAGVGGERPELGHAVFGMGRPPVRARRPGPRRIRAQAVRDVFTASAT